MSTEIVREQWLNQVITTIYTHAFKTPQPPILASIGAVTGRRKPPLVEVVIPADSADTTHTHVFVRPSAAPIDSQSIVSHLLQQLPWPARVPLPGSVAITSAIMDVHGTLPTVAVQPHRTVEKTRSVALRCSGCGSSQRVSASTLLRYSPYAPCQVAACHTLVENMTVRQTGKPERAFRIWLDDNA